MGEEYWNLVVELCQNMYHCYWPNISVVYKNHMQETFEMHFVFLLYH